MWLVGLRGHVEELAAPSSLHVIALGIIIGGRCDRAGYAARNIDAAAFRADRSKEAYALRDDPTVFRLGFRPLVRNMLLLVPSDDRLCAAGVDMRRCFERHAGVVGAVLILSVLAGLTCPGTDLFR